MIETQRMRSCPVTGTWLCFVLSRYLKSTKRKYQHHTQSQRKEGGREGGEDSRRIWEFDWRERQDRRRAWRRNRRSLQSHTLRTRSLLVYRFLYREECVDRLLSQLGSRCHTTPYRSLSRPGSLCRRCNWCSRTLTLKKEEKMKRDTTVPRFVSVWSDCEMWIWEEKSFKRGGTVISFSFEKKKIMYRVYSSTNTE